jgi:hypothetical protein
MQTITTIGLDIAKSVFQVHGVDAAGGSLGGSPSPEKSAGARSLCGSSIWPRATTPIRDRCLKNGGA